MRNQKTSLQKKLRVFFNRGILSVLCFGVILIFVAIALLAPVITAYDPYEQDVANAYQDPSAEHLLGTDRLGRDVFSRLAYGARVSLLASFLSSLVAASIGLLLGLIAGYFHGFVSQLIMRIADAELSIPPLVLTLVLSILFGDGVFGAVLVIGISLVPTYIRLVFGLVLSQKKNDYVLAAKLIGLKNRNILSRHILPNCFPSLIVLFTMNLGTAIMLEASMSYLGIGIVPPTPTWGGMVADSYAALIMHPMLAILPGICIILVAGPGRAAPALSPGKGAQRGKDKTEDWARRRGAGPVPRGGGRAGVSHRQQLAGRPQPGPRGADVPAGRGRRGRGRAGARACADGPVHRRADRPRMSRSRMRAARSRGTSIRLEVLHGTAA